MVAAETAETDGKVVVVVIGRNEGDRLVRCLRSVRSSAVVYVDSGSKDGSIAAAAAAGALPVALDMTRPFTAARARNAGAEAALAQFPAVECLQFVDGDCEIDDQWLTKGLDYLAQNPDVGIVCGFRRERNRQASIYNMMCDLEWNGPVGAIAACGGDMMVRIGAFRGVDGFRPGVIAAEDDEFCVRVRKSGWAIHRVDAPMTLHDAAMTRFHQWWRRSVRAGHAFAEVNALHPDHFAGIPARIALWGGAVPLAAILPAVPTQGLSLLLLLLYPMSFVHIMRKLRRQNINSRDAFVYGIFLTISKFPNLLGLLTYWTRRYIGGDRTLIEYK